MNKQQEMFYQLFFTVLKQAVKKKFSEAELNQWQVINLPPNHPLKKNANAISFVCSQRYPMQQIGAVAQWLHEEFKLDKAMICVNGSKLPNEEQPLGALLIPDINALLACPKIKELISPNSSTKQVVVTPTVVKKSVDEKALPAKAISKSQQQTSAVKAAEVAEKVQEKKEIISPPPTMINKTEIEQQQNSVSLKQELISSALVVPSQQKKEQSEPFQEKETIHLGAEKPVKKQDSLEHKRDELLHLGGPAPVKRPNQEQNVLEVRPINEVISSPPLQQKEAPPVPILEKESKKHLGSSEPKKLEDEKAPVKVTVSEDDISEAVSTSSFQTQPPEEKNPEPNPITEELNQKIKLIILIAQIQQDILNQLPYFTPRNGLSHHTKLQQEIKLINQQVELCNKENDKPIAFMETQRKIHETYDKELTLLRELFKSIIPHIKPEGLRQKLNDIKEKLTSKKVDHQQIIELWKPFLTSSAKLKEEAKDYLGNNKLIYISFYTQLGFTEAQFNVAKAAQHEVAAYKKALKTFASSPQQLTLSVELTNQWLADEEYEDLVFMSHLVSVDAVPEYLLKQKQLFSERYQQYQTQVYQLYVAWQEDFAEIIRLNRSIDVYVKWERALKSNVEKINSQTPTWYDLSTLFKSLTYDKKTFFRDVLRTQQGFAIIQSLMDLYNAKEELHDAKKALNFFIIEKANLKEKLSTYKNEVTKNVNLWKRAFSFAELAVTQQLDFQSAAVLAQFNHWWQSYLVGPMPDDLFKKVIYLSGLTAVCWELYYTSSVGFNLPLISALNRIVLGQYDVWQSTGEMIEKVLVPVLDKIADSTTGVYHQLACRLKDMLRLDEVGLMEKDEYLVWLSGLIINLLLSAGQPMLLSIGGYSLATTISSLVVNTINLVAKELHTPKELAAVIGFFSQLWFYPRAYKYGASTVNYFFPMVRNEMNFERALEVLELDKSATESDLTKRYRDLTKLANPDRCSFFCAKDGEASRQLRAESECLIACRESSHEKINAYTDAYRVLVKKMQ